MSQITDCSIAEPLFPAFAVVLLSEMFAFVLTGEDGSRRFGYCRRLLVNAAEK